MATEEMVYTVRALAAGGRDGRVATSRGFADHVVKPPIELDGPADTDAARTNPDELFALGYASCFLNALQHIARQRRTSAKAFQMGIAVHLSATRVGSPSQWTWTPTCPAWPRTRRMS